MVRKEATHWNLKMMIFVHLFPFSILSASHGTPHRLPELGKMLFTLFGSTLLLHSSPLFAGCFLSPC